MLSEQGRDDIKRTEGILIEAYKRKHGHFPPWNEVGGSLWGQQAVMPNNYNIVKSFCTPDDFYINPIVSRSTIRELSNNSLYASFENYLHAVRMYILIYGMDYKEALDFANKNDTFGWYEKMLEAGYNLKRLVI